jgi:putative FmdB family regulatory protein
MPLYEYRCTDCNKSLEVIRKFSDPDLVDCSECGGRLEKVLSAPAIRFKGSGWYVNDYGKKNSGGSSNANSGKAAEESSKSESKSSSEGSSKSSSEGSSKSSSEGSSKSSSEGSSKSSSKVA